jgi:magnesium-protoporphyrin O-methyltransferase
MAMWQAGRLFPRADRSPAMVPHRATDIRSALGSAGRLQAILDQAVVAVPGGHFVRLELTALLAAGRPVPKARELRLCDR